MSDQSDLYGFADSLDSSRLRARLRRLEQSSPALRRGQVLFSSSNYSPVDSAALNSKGQVDLVSSAGFVVSGSMPPFVVKGNFGYVSDGTSIHWYWDGTNSSNILVIKRADGTSFSIPGGDLNVTGLANGTTYYFYPFWNVLSGCGVSFVLGTVGSPKFALTAISTDALSQQQQLGREPLTSGAMTGATTAGGGAPAGGGYAGGGGKPGFCTMLGTSIVPLLPEWEHEETLHPQSEWMRLASGKHWLHCVPNHPLYSPDGERIDANKFKVGDWITHQTADLKLDEVSPFLRACSKVEVRMPIGHLYWANGFLSHNIKADESL